MSCQYIPKIKKTESCKTKVFVAPVSGIIKIFIIQFSRFCVKVSIYSRGVLMHRSEDLDQSLYNR